eukprot:363468-Amorphochlora_amoeboformis.AAC.1
MMRMRMKMKMRLRSAPAGRRKTRRKSELKMKAKKIKRKPKKEVKLPAPEPDFEADFGEDDANGFDPRGASEPAPAKAAPESFISSFDEDPVEQNNDEWDDFGSGNVVIYPIYI